MTPEQIAAALIGLAVARSLCVMPEGACPERGACQGCQHDAQRAGRAAVEAISAAGLVVVPAGRIADMMDALRQARDWITQDRRDIVDCHTVADANEWRDESTMDDLAKEAVAEIDTLLARIAAALGAPADA